LVAIWIATGGASDHDRIVRLLILLGSRAGEIGGMRWGELNLDSGTWALPADRSKNHRAHAIVLPAPALDIIRGVPQQIGRDWLFGVRGNGFAEWSRAKHRLDQRLGVPAWKVHDIRRSVATHMGDLGFAPHVIEGVLGHHRQNVATTYNRSRYDREVTAALAAWAAHVLALVEGRESNVVTLHA
jgi:integrase